MNKDIRDALDNISMTLLGAGGIGIGLVVGSMMNNVFHAGAAAYYGFGIGLLLGAFTRRKWKVPRTIGSLMLIVIGGGILFLEGSISFIGLLLLLSGIGHLVSLLRVWFD